MPPCAASLHSRQTIVLPYLLAAPVGLFALGVILLRTTHRSPVPELQETRLDDLDPAVFAALGARLDEAERLGFRLAALLDGFMPPSVTYGIRVAAWLVHPTERHQLMISVAHQLDGTKTIAEFSTQWADGREIDTGDAPLPEIFAYPAGKQVFRLPPGIPLRALYDAHRALVARHARDRGAPHLPDPTDIAAVITGQVRADLAHQASRGRMRALDGGGYGLTWRGAVWCTWRLAPFLDRWHAGRQRRAAEALAASLAAA